MLRTRVKQHPDQRGYSLMEALIVIGVIAVIVLVALPAFFRFLQSYRVQTSAQQMTMAMRFARNAAVKQKIKFRMNIRDELDGTEPNTYYFEYDPDRDGTFSAYNELDPTISQGVVIRSGGVTQLTFDSRGRCSNSGTIRLVGEDGTTYDVTVNVDGGVSTDRQ